MSMERVKEIEAKVEHFRSNLLKVMETCLTDREVDSVLEIIQGFEEVVEQQNEQIEELEQANVRGNGHVKACEERIEELHSDRDMAVTKLGKRILEADEKDQRIEDMQKSINTNNLHIEQLEGGLSTQQQYIKELRDIFEEIKGEEEFTRGRVFELAEQALNK